jgi:hypothetical protein
LRHLRNHSARKSVTDFEKIHRFFISNPCHHLQPIFLIPSQSEVRFGGGPCYFLTEKAKARFEFTTRSELFHFHLSTKEPPYMMTRKERRAAEHATRKADRKSGFPTPEPVVANNNIEAEEPVTAPEAKPEISEAQLAANRANAQLSTGATSEAGKKKVSLNALKTGLTGRQVLLPADDGALYEAMVRDYQNHFLPVGPEEIALVQSIVDVRWRLDRYPGLESALLDVGRKLMLEIEPKLAGNPAPAFEMQIRLTTKRNSATSNCKRTVSSAVANAKRRNFANCKRLGKPQGRKAKAKPAEAGAKPNAASAPAGNGFVFSPSQLADYLASLTPEARENLLMQMITPAAFAAETTSAAA